MPEFDPRKGPAFGKKTRDDLRLDEDDTRSVGFVVGALGGGVTDAAVVKFAVERAREEGEERHVCGGAEPTRGRPRFRSWFRRGGCSDV